MLQKCIYALMAVLLTCAQSSAKGGSYRSEDRYNPQHIDGLPPEIRNAIHCRCGTPKALHRFANYSDDARRIVLHFEHFVCDGDSVYCTASGWLHQVYGSVGGHYKLIRSYYAPAGE
jgi:hypothetical protein